MPWLFPTSYHYHRFQCRQPKSIKPSNKQTNIKPQRPVNPPSIRDTSTSPTTAQIKVGRFQLGSPPPPPAALPLSRGHEWRAGGAPPIWVTAPERFIHVSTPSPGFTGFTAAPLRPVRNGARGRAYVGGVFFCSTGGCCRDRYVNWLIRCLSQGCWVVALKSFMLDVCKKYFINYF